MVRLAEEGRDRALPKSETSMSYRLLPKRASLWSTERPRVLSANRARTVSSPAASAASHVVSRVVPVLVAIGCLGALLLVSTPVLGGSGEGVELTLVPTRIQQVDQLRINTGRKAVLADGSFNTVYERRLPKKGHVFLEVRFDLAVDGGTASVSGRNMVFVGGGGVDDRFYPVDWMRDLGLEEERGETLLVEGGSSFEATFEVPADRHSSLTLWVEGVEVGSVPEITRFTEARRW